MRHLRRPPPLPPPYATAVVNCVICLGVSFCASCAGLPPPLCCEGLFQCLAVWEGCSLRSWRPPPPLPQLTTRRLTTQQRMMTWTSDPSFGRPTSVWEPSPPTSRQPRLPFAMGVCAHVHTHHEAVMKDSPGFWWGGWTHVQRTRSEYEKDSARWKNDRIAFCLQQTAPTGS